MGRESVKERAEVKFLLASSYVYNGASTFGSLLRESGSKMASKAKEFAFEVNHHVPELFNKFQQGTASCVNCGSPACTAAFGAAAIIPIIFSSKEKLELIGSTIIQHFRPSA